MLNQQPSLEQNQTLSPSPIDQLPSTEDQRLAPSNRANSFLLIIGGLFLIAFFLFLFFAYQFYEKIKIVDKYQSENQYPAVSPVITPPSELPGATSVPSISDEPLPTPIVENTTDKPPEWKTYSNSQVGISFRYPPNIELMENNTINLSYWGPTQQANTEFYDGISLRFSLLFKIEGLSLTDYVDQQIALSQENGEIETAKTPITINNYQGYYYVVSGLGSFKYIYLQSPSAEWVVEIVDSTVDPTNQGYLDTVQQILNSFQFEKLL